MDDSIKRRIELPSVKWLTGNNVAYSRNRFTGSYGTDPFGGITSRTTFSFRAGFVMPPKPAEGEQSAVPLNVPAGFEAAYRLIYPFGHKPAESEETVRFFQYEPSGGEPVAVTSGAVEQAEQWLNSELDRLIQDGVIIEVI